MFEWLWKLFFSERKKDNLSYVFIDDDAYVFLKNYIVKRQQKFQV